MYEAQIKDLKASLPKLVVSTDADQLDIYARDWTQFYKPHASAVLFPASTDDVTQIIDWARKSQVSIVPSGGRTGLSAGAYATQGEVILSMELMNQFLDFSPVDRLVTCQAGVITQQIQDFAHNQNLFFPVDFGATGSSHIGGNVATNAGGVRVLRYRGMRNWVRGLTVVTGDGKVLKLGKGLVKDNTGYDLMNLMIGSEGTLGIITEVSCELATEPPPYLTVTLGCRDLTSVMQVYQELSQHYTLTAFEMYSDQALKHVLRQHELKAPTEQACEFYILIEMEDAHLKQHDAFLESFEALVNNGHVVDGSIAQSPQEVRHLWSLRERITESLAQHRPYKNDISVRISRIPQLIAQTEALLTNAYPDFEVIWFGHIGDGNLHISILKPLGLSDDEFTAALTAVNPQLFGIIQQLGGSVSAEHGVGLVKKPYLNFSRTPDEIAYMRAIKKVFDPDQILNPGKIF